MASINRVTLIGNLGRDPERQTTSNGTPYAKFSVATNESYQDRNGNWQKSTEWHNVKVWGASVDRVLQQLRKGSLVYIEGSLRSFEMNDQQMSSGPKVKLWEIKAITWRSLDPRENQGGDFSQGNAGNSGFGGGGGGFNQSRGFNQGGGGGFNQGGGGGFNQGGGGFNQGGGGGFNQGGGGGFNQGGGGGFNQGGGASGGGWGQTSQCAPAAQQGGGGAWGSSSSQQPQQSAWGSSDQGAQPAPSSSWGSGGDASAAPAASAGGGNSWGDKGWGSTGSTPSANAADQGGSGGGEDDPIPF